LEEIKVYKLENEFLKVELLNLGATIKKLEAIENNAEENSFTAFYAKNSRYIDNVAGVIFIGFGLKLIYEGITHLAVIL